MNMTVWFSHPVMLIAKIMLLAGGVVTSGLVHADSDGLLAFFEHLERDQSNEIQEASLKNSSPTRVAFDDSLAPAR